MYLLGFVKTQDSTYNIYIFIFIHHVVVAANKHNKHANIINNTNMTE